MDKGYADTVGLLLTVAPEVSKGYAIELQYAGGRIFLKTFREPSLRDQRSFHTRPSDAGPSFGSSASHIGDTAARYANQCPADRGGLRWPGWMQFEWRRRL